MITVDDGTSRHDPEAERGFREGEIDRRPYGSRGSDEDTTGTLLTRVSILSTTLHASTSRLSRGRDPTRTEAVALVGASS